MAILGNINNRNWPFRLVISTLNLNWRLLASIPERGRANHRTRRVVQAVPAMANPVELTSDTPTPFEGGKIIHSVLQAAMHRCVEVLDGDIDDETRKKWGDWLEKLMRRAGLELRNDN